MADRPKPVVLAILDGWGIAPPGRGNAISLAKTPNMTKLWNAYTHTQLIAHGESVGLPKHEPGNTETGHLNLGAGRIVYQDLPRINMAIADGSFFRNSTLLGAINHVKQNHSHLHIAGLVGGGGVHSDLSHLFALLRLCHEQQANDVIFHAFTDGRDSPPTAAMTYINQVQAVMSRESVGRFGSVMGRYYAMDRDFRWDRTAKAYFCLTAGQGKQSPSVDRAISAAYDAGQTDEFIEPTVIMDGGQPARLVGDNDAFIFFNFRIDRPRQLTKAFVLSDFEQTANRTSFDPYAIRYLKRHIADDKTMSKSPPFTRGAALTNLFFVTLTEYEKNLPVHTAFPPQIVENPLGKLVADAGLRQLRVAESEKERFVTYYFNGQREDPFTGEERLIIPSPKVATYDLRPEMAAREITTHLVSEIKSGLYDLIVINYANPDMVAHTGNIKATIVACEVTDACIGELATVVADGSGGVLCITADHGNAEEVINLVTSEMDTEHNANPVPFILVGRQFQNATQLPQGILADVTPTLLAIMGIKSPLNITGRNLLR